MYAARGTVIILLMTPDENRDDAWHIRKLLAEFEITNLTGEVADLDETISSLNDDIRVLDVIITISQNSIGWCECR